MNQSDILRASYEMIYKNLSAFAEERKFFLISNESAEPQKTGSQPRVCLGISDVSQLCIDKNGQKIEEDEMTFEASTRVGCILFLTVIADAYPPLLETIGLLIRYFKDNNSILLVDYKWHGENEGIIYIEPVIRKPEPQKESKFHNNPSITLEYYMEMGINSLKGTTFKRVDKRTIKGNIIG
jgi:hypothetical protein